MPSLYDIIGIILRNSVWYPVAVSAKCNTNTDVQVFLSLNGDVNGKPTSERKRKLVFLWFSQLLVVVMQFSFGLQLSWLAGTEAWRLLDQEAL